MSTLCSFVLLFVLFSIVSSSHGLNVNIHSNVYNDRFSSQSREEFMVGWSNTSSNGWSNVRMIARSSLTSTWQVIERYFDFASVKCSGSWSNEDLLSCFGFCGAKRNERTVGIEPTTNRLRVGHSTDWVTHAKVLVFQPPQFLYINTYMQHHKAEHADSVTIYLLLLHENCSIECKMLWKFLY